MNNKKTLQLACSPGTFGKIQADVEYRNSVAQQAVGEETYDEIIFSPNPDTNAEKGTQEENAETCTEADARKTMWLDAATNFQFLPFRLMYFINTMHFVGNLFY